MEFYIKTLVIQLNIKLDYEKKKECFIANEEEFNIIVNKVNLGLCNVDIDEDENHTEIEEEPFELSKRQIKKIDAETKIDKDLAIKKFEDVTELLKNKIISVEDYKEILKNI